VVIDRPDRRGRRAILEVHARKIPLAEDADLESVAAVTAGVAGADLANLLNEAALQAVRSNKEKVGRAELDEAVERTVAGLARKSRALTLHEKRRVAHHEAGHTIVARHLVGVDPVRKVSILPRGVSALGFTMQTPTEDHVLLTRSELENRIAVLMGGRVAERLWLDEVSTGAQDDLAKATQIARAMVRAYGMSETLGPLSLEQVPSPLSGIEKHLGDRHDESPALSEQVDQEVRSILERQEKRVSELLARESGSLSRLALALIDRESLNAEDLLALLGPVEPHSDGMQAVPS
jgi:cell division protease FtsH